VIFENVEMQNVLCDG